MPAPEPTPEPINPDDLVAITYVIPAKMAPRLQRLISPLLDQIETENAEGAVDLTSWDSTSFQPPHSGPFGGASAWTLPPIGADDERLVCWAIDNMTDNGRALAGGLLVREEIRTVDLAELVGYGKGVGPAFRAMTNRMRAIGRKPFWNGNPTTKNHPRGQVLSVNSDSDAYRLVLDVFNARYPDDLDVGGVS